MNYQTLRANVVEQLEKGQKTGGKAQTTKPTFAQILTIIQTQEVSLGDLQSVVASEMLRDILETQGTPEAEINKALEAAA